MQQSQSAIEIELRLSCKLVFAGGPFDSNIRKSGRRDGMRMLELGHEWSGPGGSIMKRRLLFAILLIIVLALIVKYGAAAAAPHLL